ncbi:MAG: hypothetical protein ABSA02_05850 [Trebonia sp.]|jgi:hypothetical protein
MNLNTTMHSALAGVRRHPVRAAAICVPLVLASVFTGTTMASARPEATLTVPVTALNAAPAQHVMLFDNGLPSQPAQAKLVTPKIAWNVDGCDHDYGTANVCVPWAIPGATPQAKCAWLTSNGFAELKVYGTNRQDLPETAEGYVCASGE